MPISDRSRKLLWGKSGNRCALCRHVLVADGNDADDPSIIGDECHIVAREAYGPRGASNLSVEARDEYDNLILLCKIHHKVIDDQTNTYTVEGLKTIKEIHEAWVNTSLSPKQKKIDAYDPFLVYRVRSGREILNIVVGCHASQFDTVSPESEEEIDLLGGFEQNLRDYVDIFDEMGSKDRLRTELENHEVLQEIEAAGLLVYGCQHLEQMFTIVDNEKRIDNWRVGIVLIIRKSNPLARRKMEEIESIFVQGETVQDEYSNFILVKRDKPV